MRRWRPQPSLGRWIALLLMLAVLAGAVALGIRLAQALSGPPEHWSVTIELYWQIVGFLVLLLLAAALAYRALAAFTLSYELDRNGFGEWEMDRAFSQLIAPELIFERREERPRCGKQ